MPFDVTGLKIERVLQVMEEPAPGDPLLAALFLSLGRDPEDPETEAKIWQAWSSHANAEAEARMQRALQLFGSDQQSKALSMLDDLIDAWPDWAEAWNKRATLRFMIEDFDGSLDDIAETLVRESRHFGALSGCGQICLHVGDFGAAEQVFARALAVHPGLASIADAVAALRRRPPDVLN